MNETQDNYSEIVLGTLMLDLLVDDKADMDMAKLELSPDDFDKQFHRDVFATILELLKSGQGITPEIIEIELPKITGNNYHNIANEVERIRDYKAVLPAYLPSYIKGLKKERDNIRLSRGTNLLSTIPPAEIEISQIEGLRDLVARRDSGDEKLWDSPADLVDKFIEDCKTQDKHLIPTGITTIDTHICPQAGDLIVIASRPGIGKTTLLTNIFMNMLTDDNIPCLFCPTETQPKQFMGKMVALISGIPSACFRSNSFTPEQLRVLDENKSTIIKANCGILDKSFPSINEIMKSVKEKGAKVVFIDYLGHCDMPQKTNDSRARSIEKFVVELKINMIDNKLLGFLSVQLSREVDKFPNTAPSLKDLSDSSSVEKEADAVVFMWNNRKIFQDFDNPTRETIIAKNRWGGKKKFGLKLNTINGHITEELINLKESKTNDQDDE